MRPLIFSPKQIQEFKTPEGTLILKGLVIDGVFDKSKDFIIQQFVAGAVVLRLWRDKELNLCFTHSSPGTGTRTAKTNLTKLIGCTKFHMSICWSPKEVVLEVCNANNTKERVTSKGTTSDFNLYVQADGSVCQTSTDVMGLRINLNGQEILSPTAIEVWNMSIDTIGVLLSGTSPEGFMFDVVIRNCSIVILVNGFEVYCKQRFLELEKEGIKADIEKLKQKFYTKEEREKGIPESEVEAANLADNTFCEYIIRKKRIDFQNYEKSKLAFSKGYGIKFGTDLDISNINLEKLQKIIKYRHKIIHVNPLETIFDTNTAPPTLLTKDFVLESKSVFNEFITSLHSATLQLRPR